MKTPLASTFELPPKAHLVDAPADRPRPRIGGSSLFLLQDKAEARRALALLIEPGAVFELRCLDAKLDGNRYKSGVVSGYFDNADAAVESLAKLVSAKGCYLTLNPVEPALLARCANRLDYADKGATTGDQHIGCRRWLLIDVDADRPSGISATDAEKEIARKTARTIYKLLKDQGWPDPVIADSGNGVHLLYRVDLPADDGGLLKSILAGLADYFDGDGAKVDRTVFNAARIVRLYGTRACKGDNTDDRPHRMAKLVKVPAVVEVVSEDQLRAFVAKLQPPTTETKVAASGSANGSASVTAKRNGSFDLDGFLTRYGVAVKDTATEPDGTRKLLLANCPFNSDHVDGEAAVFQGADGKLGFNCFHNTCADKHWQDFRNHFEPNRTNSAPPVATAELPAAKSALPPWTDGAAFCASEIVTPPEVIHGVLHQACKMVIGGSSKAKKTWLLLHLALAVSAGRKWLNFETTKGRVLFVNFELPTFAMQARLRAIARSLGIEILPDTLTVWNLRGHAAPYDVLLPMITEAAKVCGFSLIILDPSYKLLGDADENSASDIARLLNELERLTVNTGAAIAFTAHFAKGNASGKEAQDRISGSGVFARDPDAIMVCTALEAADGYAVESILRTLPPQPPFAIRWQYPTFALADDLDPADLKQSAKATKPTPTAEQVLALFTTNTSEPRAALLSAVELRALFDLRGWNRTAAPAVRDQLVAKGSLKVHHGAHNTKLTGLPPMVDAYTKQQAEADTILEQPALKVRKPKRHQRK